MGAISMQISKVTDTIHNVACVMDTSHVCIYLLLFIVKKLVNNAHALGQEIILCKNVKSCTDEQNKRKCLYLYKYLNILNSIGLKENSKYYIYIGHVLLAYNRYFTK